VQWLICLARSVIILVVSEIWKAIRRRLTPAPPAVPGQARPAG
jgi:hypothetical protein